MGLMRTLGRIFRGEPAFQPGDESRPEPYHVPHDMSLAGRHVVGEPHAGTAAHQPEASQPEAAHPETPHGPKEFPEVTINRFHVQEHEHGLECELHIHNHSHGQIHLTRLEILGMVDRLSYFLAPGAMREVVVHLPTRPTNTAMNQCKLFYEDETGDYFSSVHMVQFVQLPDKTYTIHRINFLPPIRDV